MNDSLVVLLPTAVMIATSTWWLSTKLHKIDKRFIHLEGNQWTQNDMRCWVRGFTEKNEGINVPSVSEIVSSRSSV